MVTFMAHLNSTITHLTRYKQKVVLAAMLEGKSNVRLHTNCQHRPTSAEPTTPNRLPTMLEVLSGE